MGADGPPTVGMEFNYANMINRQIDERPQIMY